MITKYESHMTMVDTASSLYISHHSTELLVFYRPNILKRRQILIEIYSRGKVPHIKKCTAYNVVIFSTIAVADTLSRAKHLENTRSNVRLVKARKTKQIHKRITD